MSVGVASAHGCSITFQAPGEDETPRAKGEGDTLPDYFLSLSLSLFLSLEPEDHGIARPPGLPEEGPGG